MYSLEALHLRDLPWLLYLGSAHRFPSLHTHLLPPTSCGPRPSADLLFCFVRTLREADCRLQANEKDDAINAYWNASKSFVHISSPLHSFSRARATRLRTLSTWCRVRRLLSDCFCLRLVTPSYKKSTSLTSLPDAVNSLTHAITLLTQLGRFRQAADRQKEVGQILKESDLPAARDAMEKAGEWYSMEDANA